MARMEYAVPADARVVDEALAPVVGRIVEQRGSLLNLYRMLLHSPPIADGFLHLGTAVR